MDLHGWSKHSKPKIREVTAEDPLPQGWEMIIHPDNGWPIFVNHDKKTTSFTDPRPAQPVTTTRPTEIFREKKVHTPPADQQRMRQGMDFFESPRPFFNQNQTLNRQRFPTINRRPQSPLQDEWFRRGAGSLSPSQIRRLNQQNPSHHEQRGFGSQRTPGSPGQSRRIPIMVADGHGGYRTLEKDRDLMDERSFSPNQRDSHYLQRQSSYESQHPVEQHHQSLDRENSQEGRNPAPHFNHHLQQQRNAGGRVSNEHNKGQASPSENKPRTFNIPIQIEGQGRECFVKDETPSEDEGYSQEEYSSQVEDENRNIKETATSPESPRGKFKNVRNTPRYVSEAHFPTLRREVGDVSDPQSDFKNMIINEDAKKETSKVNGSGVKQTYPAPDYPPFPEVCTPGEMMEHETGDHSSTEEASSNVSNSSTVPVKQNSKNDEVKFNMDIKNEESIPLPPPPTSALEKEESGPSGSDRSHEGGSTKSSDSETDISQSSPQPTPLEKIAKITEKITELGQDVQKFSGTEKTKEYRRIEEYLMRALLSLDKIDTQGDTTIRTERKKAVQKAQSFLSDLEDKVTK